ncbi:MAG: hypothetical protein V5A42_05210, partial [Halofilum sp. (in: g-proteobacteria)]
MTIGTRPLRTDTPAGGADAANLWRMLTWLRPWRGRVVLALGALIVAKLAVGVPLLLKQVV